MRLVRPAETVAPETMSRIRTGCGRAEARPYDKKPTSESHQTQERLMHGSSGRFAMFAHVVVFVVHTPTA